EGPGDSALVREIRAIRGVADDRLLGLDADERPRADAEEGRLRAVQRSPRYGRAGVVGRGGDGGRAGDRALLVGDESQARPRLDDGREELRGDLQAVQDVRRPRPGAGVEALGR